MKSLKIQDLAIYPVKSCAPLALSQFRIGAAGPEAAVNDQWIGDRQWMFVDPDGKFVTQRSLSQMALIQPVIEENKLKLQINSQGFEIPEAKVNDKKNVRKTVSVWGKVIDVRQVSKEISQAASDFLKTPVELVFYDERSEREALIKGKGLGVQTRFTDTQPYLVISQESLENLNSRLTTPITADRFRANIVLSGTSQPFAEDEWTHFGNSLVDFEATKACSRCRIITVDPQAGQVLSGEPLKVLAQFRRKENEKQTQVYFGQYFLSRSFGQFLKVGDSLSSVS